MSSYRPDEMSPEGRRSSRDLSPSTYARTPAALAPVEPLCCDLCGEPTVADRAVFAATGLNICPDCLEGYIDASTDQPRAEVGLVGGGH